MSASDDLIDFEIIENQKENIQSLPSGRSARALANLFSPTLQKQLTPTPSDTQNINDIARQEFEEELLNISESDDPLDIYDRYVRWTLDAYPSAQATTSSGLLPLLERATKTFQSAAQYKNDPRYLKLWLQYIRLFSPTPRETFAFLARHNIGDGLALYYEEFAGWLENAGRWSQAAEIYKMGMEKEARPAPRLLRKYNEFLERFATKPEANEPSSPALPKVRAALATRVDPFAAAAPRDPQAPSPSAGLGSTTSSRTGKKKMQIFSDENGDAPAVTESTKGWENIGSLADRKKENMMEPKPWSGETLKAGGKKSSTKLAVFKDERQSLPTQTINPNVEQVTVNPKNGRRERIFVNLEAVYPTPGEIGTELSFEELRAAHRGYLSLVWEPVARPRHEIITAGSRDTTEQTNSSIDAVSRDVSEKLVIAQDPVILDENGAVKSQGREGKPRKMRMKEVNKTQIITAKLSSPSGPKMTKRKSSREQTMTLHTRAATDEIYAMFDQPLKSVDDEEEESESDDDDGDMTDGDYTSGGESTGTGRLATSEAGDDETEDVKSVSEWSECTGRRQTPKLDENGDLLDGAGDDTRGTQFAEDDEDEEFEAIHVGVPTSTDEEDELVKPISPELPATRTSYVPIPPEDYVGPLMPYRDPSQISQNRLPFMTPIVEKTESSMGGFTGRAGNDYYNSKTPSKGSGTPKPSVRPDGLGSSPFQEIVNNSRPLDKIAQPQLGIKKTTALAPKIQAAPLAKEIVQKGPIIHDSQCNPVDEEIRRSIFTHMKPPLSSFVGFFDHSEEIRGKGAEIRKFTKAISKTSKRGTPTKPKGSPPKGLSDKTASSHPMPPVLHFPGIDRVYKVKRDLGAGAFAPVFLIETVTEKQNDENENAVMGKGAFDQFNRKSLEALKMEDPPTAWEFYVTRQAKRRLGVSRAAESIIDVYEMHLYKDECYLIEEFRDQGTLLDLINISRADSNTPGGVMDEVLVMFFAIELFRTIEALHSKEILHGDLKADNCLVRFDHIPDEDVWSTRYRKDGTGGWNMKGISLIDFGRGIDMKAFKPDVQFIADWKTTPQDCAEMRELRPWTHQIDYHGLAGIIHSMLFGKYIDTVHERPGGGGLGGGLRKWKLKEGLKRYWQTDIWTRVFDLLLNPMSHVEGEQDGKLPVVRGMRMVREEMEAWLEGNSEKGVGLQAGLRKLEWAVGQRRK